VHDEEMSETRLVAEFATPLEFLAAYDEEIAVGGLLVRGASIENAAAMSDCSLVVRIGGAERAEEKAKLAGAMAGGVAVIFISPPAALDALAAELRNPPEPDAEAEPEPGAGDGLQQYSTRQRLAELSPAQKMALALSCGREERFHLLRDNNKVLHAYVLRNPRIGIEEVQAAAKLNSLSPEALKAIADHAEWGQNAAICAALVRNPKTPMPIALRLLPRLQPSEVRALAKGTARQPIVLAARKMLLR
jgi:hypothetical protein